MAAQELNGAATSLLQASQLASQFHRDLVDLIPHLRAFSRVLCGRQAIAEDMAQEALAKAWRSRDCFEPGTNLKAWLFTILRNEFYSHVRRARRETQWDADAGERIPAAANAQEWATGLSEMVRALGGLAVSQREALLLVGAGGLSYEDAAKICRTPVGTVKSRVARARAALTKILEGDKPLPPHSPVRTKSASDDILAQLNVITRRGVLANQLSSAGSI
jgi:RNA polymerase sigma-70 factor (ECF subfamily)